MSTIQRILAVLALPNTVPEILKTGEGVVHGMTGNTWFPAPVPALTTVSADLTALSAAEVLARTHAVGMATGRDGKLRTLVSDLHLLRGYVQGVADANPADAATLIESAGMAVKKPSTYVKPPLAVKQGPVSGSIVIAARAIGPRAAYEWAWSLDQKTWTSLPDTLQAKTQVVGLTPGAMVFVRMRALSRKELGDWGQVVSFLVK